MTKTKPVRGLLKANSGELPIWANNILKWLGYQHIIKMQLELERKTQENIDRMSRWQKFIHGYPQVNHAPGFFLSNPFPAPSAENLEKFETTYPDMAKEWSSGV